MITNQSRSDMLLPCPCCGAEPVVHDHIMIFDCNVFVECPECGLRTGEAAYYPENWPHIPPDLDREHVFEMVAASWNLRAPLPQPPPVRRVWRRTRYVPVYKVRSVQ